MLTTRHLLVLAVVFTIAACSGGDAPAPQKTVFADQEQALEKAKQAEKMIDDTAKRQARKIEEETE